MKFATLATGQGLVLFVVALAVILLMVTAQRVQPVAVRVNVGIATGLGNSDQHKLRTLQAVNYNPLYSVE